MKTKIFYLFISYLLLQCKTWFFGASTFLENIHPLLDIWWPLFCALRDLKQDQLEWLHHLGALSPVINWNLKNSSICKIEKLWTSKQVLMDFPNTHLNEVNEHIQYSHWPLSLTIRSISNSKQVWCSTVRVYIQWGVINCENSDKRNSTSNTCNVRRGWKMGLVESLDAWEI